MKKTIKLVEVQTPKGEAFFQFRIVESVITEEEASPPKPQPTPGGNGTRPKADPPLAEKPQNGEGKSQSVPGDPMTDSQKRYLFRIMAVRGKEGEDAHEELKRLFQVKTLKDVTKLDASRMIEDLLEKEKQGNGGGDGTPF